MPTPLTEKYREKLEFLIRKEENLGDILNLENLEESFHDGRVGIGFSALPLREVLFWEIQKKRQKKY